MELFNKFRETIFLKSDSTLEQQITELKEIRNNLKYTDNIDRDIKLLELGLKGEKEIEFELKNANLGMYVLHDITIGIDDLTAQIDYIVVTKGYTYLIECKNLVGDITVDNKGQFKREYEYKGKIIKEAIYSPYTQATRHQEIIKKIWLSKSNKLKTLLFEKDFDKLWYKSIVVLANSKSILNTKYAPKEIRDNTIRVDQLISYIKKDLEKYDKTMLYNKNNMLKIANKYLEDNISEYKSIAQKYKTNENHTADLITNLKQFRKEKSQKMNVPAYYIFTDKELEDIIKNKPSNIADLKNLNILSDIKLQLHGNEIINIINNY